MNERKQLSDINQNQKESAETCQDSLINFYKTPNNNSRSISVSKKLPPHNPNSLKTLSSPKDYCIPSREVTFPGSNYSSTKSTSSPSKRLLRMYKDSSNKENQDPVSSHKKKSISPKHQRMGSSSRKNMNCAVTPQNRPANELIQSKISNKLGESCESSISKFSETFTAVEDLKGPARNNQLKVVYKKLAEDYEKDRFYYENLCKKLKSKRDFLEKKQAELLKDMGEVNDMLAQEKEISYQDLKEIMGSKERRQQVVTDLVSKYNDLSDTLQKLQQLFHRKKETKSLQVIDAVSVFQKNLKRLLNDKTTLVYKIYEEEEALSGLKEGVLMINEEISSRDMQNTELAFEHEELDNLLEEIRTRYGIESDFIINDTKLEEEGEILTKKIVEIKQEREKQEIEKRDLEKILDELRLKISKQKETLDLLRKTKSSLKKNSLVFELEKGCHDINKENFDEIGLNAFEEIMKMFDYERISEKMTQIFPFLSPSFDKSCSLLFTYQKLALKEMKILARFNNSGKEGQSNQTNEKEKKEYLLQEIIDKKKKLWFEYINETSEEEKEKASQLLNYVSYFQTLDQSFLNFINSVRNPRSLLKLEEQLFSMMEKKMECFEDQFKCAASLHVYTREYQTSYSELLSHESKQNLICSRISAGLKEISNIKAKIQEIDEKRRIALEKFCSELSRTSEKLYQSYIGEKEKLLKEVKFKYGKNYAEKVQMDIRSEIFTMNSEQVEKTKEKIRGILRRVREIDCRRQHNQQAIEVELSENRKSVQNDIDKKKAILTILSNELLSVTCQEKKLNADLEAVLGNVFFSEGCFEEEEAFGSLKERLRHLQRKTEYVINQGEGEGILKESLLTPFTRQRLLEEKLGNIKSELDKLQKKDLKEIQELEKEVLTRQSSLQEKKSRIDVIQENIKKCCDNSFFTTDRKSQEDNCFFSEAASMASEERTKRPSDGLLEFEGENVNRKSINNLSPSNYTSGKHKPTRSFQDCSSNSMSKYGKITITMTFPEADGTSEKRDNHQELSQPSSSLNQINFSDIKLDYLLYGDDHEVKCDSNLKESKKSGISKNNLLSPTFSSYKEHIFMSSNQTETNEKVVVESSVSSTSKSSSHNNSIQSMLMPILREEEHFQSGDYSFSLPSQRDPQKIGMNRCTSTYIKGTHKKGESLHLPSGSQAIKAGQTPEYILEKLERGICVFKRFVIDKGNSLKHNSDYDVLDSTMTPEKSGYGRRILNIKFKQNKIEFRKEHLGKIQIENQYPLSSINTFKLSSNAIQTLRFKQMYRGQRDFGNVQDHKKFLKHVNCTMFEFYIILDNIGKINCICCSEDDLNLIKIGLGMLNKN